VAQAITEPGQPQSLPPFRVLAASLDVRGAPERHAVELFESLAEAAYLVALADGVFDGLEREMFERVIFAACGRDVPAERLTELVSGLADRLARDGLERRVEVLAAKVTVREHAHEVLRMGALLAQASEDVSEVERDVMTRIAAALGLGAADVDAAIDEVKAAIASAGWDQLLESI
jgi:tellurite resistance protein